jgi:hypothetical protein
MGTAGKAGTIRLKDGRTLKVTRTAIDRVSDLCWMVTDEAHDDLPFAQLAKDVPPVGTAIWHAGYGVDKPGNTETGTVSGGVNSTGKLAMTLSVSSGDSGGGIFRADTNELISAVCCTTRLAGKGVMFGGSSVEAAKLRPK